MPSPEVSIVTAITQERRLAPDGNGRGQWYMPEDLERFRAITTGHAVVIAARTFETILRALDRPLPNRTNIIVGSNLALPDGCLPANDFQEGLEIAKKIDKKEVFVMGNQSFYEEAFPDVTKLYLTIVKDARETGELFPSYKDDFELEQSTAGRSGGYDYDFQIHNRKQGKLIV